MAGLNETQLVFVLGFWCGSEWSRLEFRQGMEKELRRHFDEMKRDNEEWQRKTDERLLERLDKEQQEMIAKMDGLVSVFGAAIKTIRDRGTLLRVEKAVQAELARLQAGGSATEPGPNSQPRH